VIGVDNDPLLCSLTTPPLTSVIPHTHRTGYEAALLLDRMMSGEQITSEDCSTVLAWPLLPIRSLPPRRSARARQETWRLGRRH